MDKICVRTVLGGCLEAPASKSSAQRAVACALLARGESRLSNLGDSADILAALGAAAGLGARVEREKESFRVLGSPLFDGTDPGARPPPPGGPLVLDCGESGLCMRMFAPIAALLSAEVRLGGRGSILRRPMSLAEEPLAAFGASCRSSGGFPPLIVRGPLSGGEAEIDAGKSSQLLTGLLVALPLAPRDSVVHVRNAVSRGYLDLTMATCAAFGVSVERDAAYSRFAVRGNQAYRAADFRAEGDWSGAAFLVVAAGLAAAEEGLWLRGLQDGSTQPDRAILEAASRAGIPTAFEGGALKVRRGSLRPFEFDASDCPDLFPPLAALAAACPGTSVLKGTRRLKDKESDRARSLAACLTALSCGVELAGDDMIIRGGTLRGGSVDSVGDHRIAMTAAVAALAAAAPVEIRGADCVAKSWPGFFADLEAISRRC